MRKKLRRSKKTALHQGKMTIDGLAQEIDQLAQVSKKSFDRLEAKMATKDDLKDIRADLKGFATKDDLKGFATKDDLKQLKTEIVQEFKVVAENIHQDVAGVNKDEMSLLKQKTRTLDERVTVLERHQGLRA